MPEQTEEQLIEDLAKLFGIASEYYDIFGERHVITLDTKRAILRAMGIGTSTPAHMARELDAVQEARWRQPCDAVLVRQVGLGGLWSFRMPVQEEQSETVHIEWTVRDETGRHLRSDHAGPGLQPTDSMRLHGLLYRQFTLPLPIGLDVGYYDLAVEGASLSHRAVGSMRLIIVPTHCYRPAQLQTGRRLWGVSLPLYALRSQQNWGVGDFGDLFQWAEWAARERRAGIIGLNPLHALKNSRPYHISPYSPDSRLYLNVLYVDVEQVPEFQESSEARRLAKGEEFLRRLEAVTKSETVEYERVGAVKRQIMDVLFSTFEVQHFRAEDGRLVPCTRRSEAFEQFVREEGEELEAFALFQALDEEFSRQTPPLRMWQEWPDAYRHPTSPASREYLKTHRKQVRFHQYVQWLAHQQLKRVHERTHELGMPIGLYHDLALGSDRGGSDAWLFQSVFALGADCGCPPDAFAPEGQNWGLPPVNPHALRQSGYRMFIKLLRKNLQYGGAIRLDHVMALFRLFWIPRGLPPSAGAYVEYPWDDLLGILALESVRHQAVIVGEDLGTVPDYVREKLGAWGVLSYRVFYFERSGDGAWKPPASYPAQALAVVTTHDLPTLAGFWTGEDLKIRERLGFYRDESAYRRAWDERHRDKMGIISALQREGMWPVEVAESAALDHPLSAELNRAIHTFVARTPSSFMLVTLEDLIGDTTQVNFPGTLDTYPNWSHRTPFTLEEVKGRSNVWQLARALNTLRP